MNLLEARTAHHSALNRADALVTAAEIARRPLTRNETLSVDTAMAEARELAAQITTMERRQALTDLGPITPPTAHAGRVRLSSDYLKAFQAWGRSGGTTMNAALYEGGSPSGGFAVPSEVYGTVTQLAPADSTIRQLATVLPTTKDIRFPVKAASGTTAAKPESGASANTFGGSTPTLANVPLSAFVAGIHVPLSLEIFEDAPALTLFLQQDAGDDLNTYEESLFISGSGVGIAQGMLGNVGAGITGAPPDGAGNVVYPDGMLNLVGTVKSGYLNNSTFLMNRATGILIRKAQRQAAVYEPVWTRSGGQDYLHGYPVAYSASMPNATTGLTPVMFGDFSRGYLIGDRGGSGVFVKLLDQTDMLTGTIDLILFRRMDARVRRPEAIQQYTLA